MGQNSYNVLPLQQKVTRGLQLLKFRVSLFCMLAFDKGSAGRGWVQTQLSLKRDWAHLGFEPRTTRTWSKNHTLGPTSHMQQQKHYLIWWLTLTVSCWSSFLWKRTDEMSQNSYHVHSLQQKLTRAS